MPKPGLVDKMFL